MSKLTRKQEVFVKEYVETGNGTQAAKKAYDIKPNDELTPRVIASENLTKPNIQEAIAEAIPDKLLHKIHLEGLHARRGVYRQTGLHSWEKIDEVPDDAVIARYLDMAYKLKGSYAPEKHVNLNVTSYEPSAKIKALTEKLNK